MCFGDLRCGFTRVLRVEMRAARGDGNGEAAKQGVDPSRYILNTLVEHFTRRSLH
jgi:hypothetical protein